MIKKTSMFFPTNIGERIRRDLDFQKSKALAAALAVPSQLMVAMVQEIQTMHPTNQWEKWLDNLSHESKSLREVFQKAGRIEFHLFDQPPEPCLFLSINFYPPGRQIKGKSMLWRIDHSGVLFLSEDNIL